MKYSFSKKLLSVFLVLTLIITCLPISTMAASVTTDNYTRTVDENTMDNWKKYFNTDNLDTTNAGGVWTDKSVFTDASEFPSSVTMLDGNKNFLTALSAIAANKEIKGYSTVPTDTVLILDLSNSMKDHDAEQDLVDAANNAIKSLLEINNNNRIGVVLYSGENEATSTYSGAVTRILDIDRYSTTDTDGKYLNLSNSGSVSVNQNVSATNVNSNLNKSKSFYGATYMQAGLWEAWKMFDEVPDSEIVIENNNWQAGKYRMPIVVLMTDGDPSQATSYYNDVENSQYTTSGWWGSTNTYKESNVGNGNSSNMPAGQGFLVQLTASYIKSRIENKYKVNTEKGAGRSLFYTLGFEVGNLSVAQSVLNPSKSTATDTLWETYSKLTTGSMNVTVKSRNSGTMSVAITKDSYVTDKNYVDEYFSASGDGLTNAFKDIIDEIILQSRYYPTHLEGGSPDFSGYVEFTDTLGEYMEVKHINGILLGDTLFDGHMMASKLADNSTGGLGTVENPTALGDEFIRAVKTRLGIAQTGDAQALVAKAFADGQLKYNGADDWSNYIAWYAKADGTYAGFYDKDGTEPVPADAVYINRSYGFLGETTGSIKNSDMMYMSVQVSTNITTGGQTVIWKIPASLVPMITYLVSLDGTRVETATNVNIAVEKATPIRLIYETGLRSDLNEFNISRITEAEHIAADGHSRVFWNNYFDISAPSHDDHITAMSEFTPNKDNERFYYTFDSAVHKKTNNGYAFVEENETLDENGEYYHRRYVFKADAADKKPVIFYEKMSSASIKAAKENGWQANFETIDNQTTGAWVVPKGTPARELTMYNEIKCDCATADENCEICNPTNSAHMVFHPYLSEQNNLVYVDMNLGNNGLLQITPATGIKISKTVDIFETGTSDTFKFRITSSASGSFDSWITALDETPSGTATQAVFTNGVYEVTLKKDQTLWISGIPASTTYTVEEISDNADYKIKSVHVNGTSTGKKATGTVAQYSIDDIDFVNTAVGEGNLVITKQVVDAAGNAVDVNDRVKFTAEVALTDASGNPVFGSFEATSGTLNVPSDGKFTVTLSEGESFIVRGIPEETNYSVIEKNIPNGFALNSERSALSGIVDASANDQALIVNTYTPTGVNGSAVNIQVTKSISGNRTEWIPGESYTFNLEKMDITRAAGTVIATATIDYNDTDKTHLFRLSGENYDAAGTYYYKISEVTGNQGGITYDAAERRFSVVVADSDMDGDLEIVSVNNEMNTTVSGNWLVAVSFNNVYAPTGSATATVNIQKEMTGNHPLSGYQFVLYDADPSQNTEANMIVKSGLTDAAGKTAINLSYGPTHVGNTYTYYLAEENAGETIKNIKYSEKVYKVEIKVIDNLDGTISAQTVVSDLAQGTPVSTPTFTNEYTPSESDFVTISGKKEILGDRVLNANEFEFAITATTPGAPMPAETSVKNMANGYFVFPAIEFKDGEEGTYKYEITESKANKIGGFDYDSTVYTVTVTVTDNGSRQIVANAVISNGASVVDNIVFANTYDPTDAEITIEGTKILTGKTMQADEFEFELLAVTAGAPMPASATVKNDVNGKIDFGKITYAKAGVYVYELVETNGQDARYNYDESVYTITVTVTDNSQGQLSAKKELVKNNMPSSEIIFRNGFVPTPIFYDIHADFGGEKALTGRQLEANEFEFKLINATNGQQIGDAVKNDANGKFNFPAVSLSTAGIYRYKIVETVGDKKGVTFDTASYHIYLEVEQDADGKLNIKDKQLYKGTVTQEEVGGVLTEVTNYENITTGGKIKFNNSYKAQPVNVTLEASKTLTGRKIVDGEFKFDLHKTESDYKYGEATLVQNDVVLTLEADDTGRIVFNPETFDKAGSYYYVIVEDELNEKGVTADNSVYKIEIMVTDNMNGNLVAELKVNGQTVSGSTAGTVKFHNTYKAAATEIVIKGSKTLEGRTLVADEFSFELYDKDNVKIQAVKNAADGSFAFTAIPVDKQGEYVYTIRETQGNAEGITYDASVYTVKVAVTDNLDGTFKVEYTYLKGTETSGGVTFINAYTEPKPTPGIEATPEPESQPEPQSEATPQPEATPEHPSSPKTGDNSNLHLWFALLFVSGGVFATAFYSKKKRENN